MIEGRENGSELRPGAESRQNELRIDRVFDAPRELVFRMWSAPEFLARWWGPKGLYLSYCAMDFREGGKWRYCMHQPDGADYWVSGTYEEIRAPERLSFTWIGDVGQFSTLVEIDFEDFGGRTLMHFRQAPFPNAEVRDDHDGGWSASFELLATYLELYRSGRLTASRLGWRQGEVAGVRPDLPPGIDQGNAAESEN